MTTSIDGLPDVLRIKPVVVQVHGSNEQSSTLSKSEDASARPQPVLDPQKVSEATRRVEQLFQTVRRNLEFREDTSSGRMIVSVVDAESGEVIRQIPPEQMVRMAAHLEQMNGLLLGERA